MAPTDREGKYDRKETMIQDHGDKITGEMFQPCSQTPESHCW